MWCGLIANGFVSQAFMKIQSGVSLILGVLLKGLVLKELNNPEFINKSFGLWVVSNSTNSSFESISISRDKNFLFSPLLISNIVPPHGEVKKTPGFFLSSIIFWPTLTLSPSLAYKVGFIPI